MLIMLAITSVLVGVSGWIGAYVEEPARYALYCTTALVAVVALSTVQHQHADPKIASDDLLVESLPPSTFDVDGLATEKGSIRATADARVHDTTVLNSSIDGDKRGLILTSLVDHPVGCIRILVGPEGASGGRLAKNEIILEESVVSRVHFHLGCHTPSRHSSGPSNETAPFFFLQDCGSTAGTFLYMAPWEKRRLHVHDAVKVGNTELVVVAMQEDHWAHTKPFLRVQFISGPMAGITQTVGLSPVTLGRRTTCALCLESDVTVSGQHCTLAYLESSATIVEAGFYITDLNSTNGTGLRLSPPGTKSTKVRLHDKDVFSVGATKFLVEYQATQDTTTETIGGQEPVRIA
ncbi:hypothetical protein DYB28_015950 [Aphanomyces astaci]|uniref:FHA domain-containing protein n=2 Tax=Aphanomyces astaci TaxID=112090 RepID=A0A397BPT6_APHAT|nr:hypothetical protein DYB36_000281 [Aphanomyces astaci]RLO01308.1 hypothetical protein DYB28_015950 [Aphanomyces astaci]